MNLHLRRMLPLIVLCALAPAASLAPAAAPAAEDNDPAKLLDARKLDLRGSSYVLPGEIDLIKGVVELRKRKAAMDAVDRKFRSIDRKISLAKALIGHHELEIRKLNSQLAQTQIAARQNQLIASMNALSAEIKEAIKFKQDNEAAMNKAHAEARQAYLEYALQLGEKTDKTVAQYAELAKDKTVTDAVDAVSEKLGRKLTLGPSRAFEVNTTVLKRYRDEILAGTIDLDVQNNVNWVQVLINGSTRRSMILDSGAGLVSIPADLAEELGLVPTDKDQTVRLQLADGKVVEGKLMTLKSVRVGQFEVKDVECAVLPKTLIAAEPLLGGTFLRHFTYKIDSEKGHLSLVKIKDAGDKVQEIKAGQENKAPDKEAVKEPDKK